MTKSGDFDLRRFDGVLLDPPDVSLALIVIFQGTPGLTTAAIKNKIALRVSVTGSIFLDSVNVGPDSLLPESRGLGSAFSCLNNARCALLTPSLVPAL